MVAKENVSSGRSGSQEPKEEKADTRKKANDETDTKKLNKSSYACYGIAGAILVIGCMANFYNFDCAHEAVISVGNYFPALNKWMKSIHQSNPVKGENEKSATRGHDWTKGVCKDPHLKLMTDQDIKHVEGGKLLLVLIGHVFDVTGGKTYYEPGAGYHGFIGRDGSRAFVTGEFNDVGLTDDLSGLDPQDYIGLADWLKFYLAHDTYKFVGYHVGRYFDGHGEETEEIAKFKGWIRNAEAESEKEGDLRKLFPPCNVEWTAEKGSTVWCSDRSGGIDRDWVGFPRKFFEAPDKEARCSCVHANFLADPRVKSYDGCLIDSNRCTILETDK